MAGQIELKFSLNTLPHTGLKVSSGEVDPRVVGLQYLENDPETQIFADFHRCSTDGSIVHCVLLKTNIMYCGKLYPQGCLTSTVRSHHGFGRFSGSDRQIRF